MTQNKLAERSDTDNAHSAIRTVPAKENLDGFRSTGIPESRKGTARCRQEHDFNEIQKVLQTINVKEAISDVTRLGKNDTNKTRTILLKMPTPYQRRMILLSTRKLQSIGRAVFFSHQPSKEDAERRNLALIKRSDLLQQGANSRSLKVRDGVLYVRDGNKWRSDGENGNKSGTSTTWLSMVLRKLVFNTRSIQDYQRRAAYSNVAQIKNCYSIICVTETRLTEHISDSALFLQSYEAHRKYKPSDSGNIKHAGFLVAITKYNRPSKTYLTSKTA